MQSQEIGGLRVFFRKVLLTFVEIAETQTSYKLNSLVYILVFFIYYCQAISNTFSLSGYDNLILETFDTIFQVSSLAYLFNYTSSQAAIWIIFIAINLLLWSVVGVIIWLSVIKYIEQHTQMKKNAFLQLLKEVLNTFFTTYVFLLFSPMTKMNLSLMISGSNSLIVEERSRKPEFLRSYQSFLGTLGLLVNFLITLSSFYFFRNFEYNDQNFFKRKYSIVAILNVGLRFTQILFGLLESAHIIQYTISNVFGILSLYDALIIRPFLNITLAQSYIILTVSYQLLAILDPIMEEKYIQTESFIFLVICLCPLISELALIYFFRVRIEALHYTEISVDQDYDNFTLYCEQIIYLSTIQQKDDEAKILLHQLFRFHVLNCKTEDCFTQQIDRRGYPNQQFSTETLIKLIDQMFKATMNNPKVMQDTSAYEIISLKYISFVQKYAENNLLSFFLLKKLANNKEVLSYYFELLFEIYSDVSKLFIDKKLQDLMKLKIQSMQAGSEQRNVGSKSFSEGIQQIEEISQDFTNKIIKVVTLKHTIWQQLIIQSNSMDDLMSRIIQKLKRMLNLRQDILKLFDYNFGQDHALTLKHNAAYQKLQQLYWLFVMNDIVKVSRLEQIIHDLRKRDQYKDENYLNNNNYMNGDSIIIQAGLSRENGKILNRSNTKIPTFFGYNITDWERIQRIDHLMPQHIAVLHNSILAQYFYQGYSSVMTSARKIFISDKQNFLFPVTISVSNDYLSLDDCVFNVTLLRINSNRELIMFDEFGKILGLSKHLVELLSESAQFNYLEVLETGYLHLLCPNLLIIFEQIMSELKSAEEKEDVAALQTQNLQAVIMFVNGYSDLCALYSQYNKEFKEDYLPSLMNKRDCEMMHHFFSLHKQYFQPDQILKKVKLKFTLHSSYRSFENMDEKILKSLNSTSQVFKMKKMMRYYVIECIEIIKVNSFNHQMKSNMTGEIKQNQSTISSKHIFLNENEQEDVEVNSLQESESFKYLDILNQNNVMHLDERGPYLSSREEGNFLHSEYLSPDSPKNSDGFLLKDMNDIDYQKRSFLMRMFNYQQKQFLQMQKSPNLIIKKYNEDSIGEMWPQSLDDMSQAQKQSDLQILGNKDVKFETVDEKQAEQEYDVSNVIGSQEDVDDDEDKRIVLNKKLKQNKTENQQTKQAKAQQDLSSQNSKSAQINYSASDLFLDKKMPKKYFFFTLITQCLFIVISVSSIVQIVISTSGFQSIGSFNHQVNTAYTLQSSYVKSVTGVILQYLQSKGYLIRNFSIPYDQDLIFKEYQNEGVIQFIDLIQQRFELIRLTQSHLTELDVITFYDLIAEHINSFTIVTNSVKFYQLIQGLNPNFLITSTMQLIIQNQLQYLQTKLLDNFFLVFYISLSLVLIIILLLFQLYSSFLRFQEKILLIVTRITTNEHERELGRLEHAKFLLKDLKGSYVVTNDLVPQYVYFKHDGFQASKVQEQSRLEIQEQLKDTKTQKDGGGQILSSKIYNPSLSIKSHLIQYSALATTVVVFLVGSILFALQTPLQCQQISNYYLDYSRLFSTIQHVMIWTEIKAVQPYLFHHPDEIGQTDYHTFEGYYDGWLADIQYQTAQEQIFQVSYANNQEILDLLYLDMCTVNNFLVEFPDFVKLCRSHFKIYYQNGITGFIKQLMILFYSYQVQIDTQTFTSNEQASEFLALPENWALLILFPMSFGPAIDTGLQLIQGQLITVTEYLGMNLLIYLVASGFSINILLMVYFLLHFKGFKQNYSRSSRSDPIFRIFINDGPVRKTPRINNQLNDQTNNDLLKIK